MNNLAIIVVACAIVVILFMPNKHFPKKRQRTRRDYRSHDEGGLPWTGKKKRKKKDYFWD